MLLGRYRGRLLSGNLPGGSGWQQGVKSTRENETLDGWQLHSVDGSRDYYGAMPSVTSILVPHGSVIKATRILLEKLLGVSFWVMVAPWVSARCRKAGRSFTSKPM